MDKGFIINTEIFHKTIRIVHFDFMVTLKNQFGKNYPKNIFGFRCLE